MPCCSRLSCAAIEVPARRPLQIAPRPFRPSGRAAAQAHREAAPLLASPSTRGDELPRCACAWCGRYSGRGLGRPRARRQVPFGAREVVEAFALGKGVFLVRTDTSTAVGDLWWCSVRKAPRLAFRSWIAVNTRCSASAPAVPLSQKGLGALPSFPPLGFASSEDPGGRGGSRFVQLPPALRRWC